MNGQLVKQCGITIERAREFVHECSHESRSSRLDHHLGVGVNRLTVLVFVGRWDKHGNALVEILLRYVSERRALRACPAAVAG